VAWLSNPNREGGSVSTRPMASHDDHSSAPSLTLRVTGPTARWLGLVTRTVREAALVHGRWLRMTITRALPRLHFGLLGLWPGGLSSNPNREGGSVSTRLMASHDDHSSASSLTLRVTGVSASCGLPGEISVRLGIRGTTIKTPATTPRAMAYAQI